MISFRKAEAKDSDLLFNWANDPLTRANSYHIGTISHDDHKRWFSKKLLDPSCHIYIFFEDSTQDPIGQVRIEQKQGENVIGISIDKKWRGKSYGSSMLQLACRNFLDENDTKAIFAYIKKENTASYKAFTKAGFTSTSVKLIEGVESYKMQYAGA